MEIKNSAGSLSTQYQSLVDRYKSGSISYQQALSERRELRSHSMSGQTGVNVTSPQRRHLSFAPVLLVNFDFERLNLSPTISEHQQAAQVYFQANKQSQDIKLSVTEGSNQGYTPRIDSSLWGIINTREMGQMRHNYNMAAHETLSRYAANNPEKWQAAAQDLGIDISSWQYGDQFWRQPDDSGIDVSVGVANSNAEKIFRQIASAEDVTNFNSEMAPIQREMRIRIDQGVAKVAQQLLSRLETINTKLHDFASSNKTLAAAGLTNADMQMVMVRDKAGHYTAADPSDQAKRVATLVNNNPEVRAIYDAQWNRIANRSHFLVLKS